MNSQLSHPRHANQNRHLIGDVTFLFLFKAIVPGLVINVWQKLLPHPYPQFL